MLYTVAKTFKCSDMDMYINFGQPLIGSKLGLRIMMAMLIKQPHITMKDLLDEATAASGRIKPDSTKKARLGAIFTTSDIWEAAEKLCPAAFPDGNKTKLKSDYSCPRSPADIFEDTSQQSQQAGPYAGLRARAKNPQASMESGVEVEEGGSASESDEVPEDISHHSKFSTPSQNKVHLLVTSPLVQVQRSNKQNGTFGPPVSSLGHNSSSRRNKKGGKTRTSSGRWVRPETSQIAVNDDVNFGSGHEQSISLDDAASTMSKLIDAGNSSSKVSVQKPSPAASPSNAQRKTTITPTRPQRASRRIRSGSPNSDAELEEIRRKRRKLNEHDEAIKQFSTELTSVNEQFTSLCDKVDRSQVQGNLTETHITELRATLERTRTKASETIVAMKKLDFSISHVAESTEGAVKELEEQMAAIKDNCKSLQENFASQADIRQTFEEKLSQTKTELVSLKGGMLSLTDGELARKQRVEDLQKYLENCLAPLRDGFQALKSGYVQVVADILGLSDKFAALEKSSKAEACDKTEVELLKTRHIAFQAEVAQELNTHVYPLAKKHTQDLRDCENRIEAVFLENKHLHRGHDQSIGSLYDFQQTHLKRINELETKTLYDIKNRQKKHDKILQDAKTESEDKTQRLKERIQILEDKFEQKSADVARLRFEFSQQKSPQEKLSNEHSNATTLAMLQKLGSQLDSANQALAYHKSVSNQQAAELDKVKATLASYENAAHSASLDQKAIAAEREEALQKHVKDTLSVLLQDREFHTSSFQKYNTHMETMTAELEHHRTLITGLQATNTEQEQEKTRLAAGLASQKEVTDALRAELKSHQKITRESMEKRIYEAHEIQKRQNSAVNGIHNLVTGIDNRVEDLEKAADVGTKGKGKKK